MCEIIIRTSSRGAGVGGGSMKRGFVFKSAARIMWGFSSGCENFHSFRTSPVLHVCIQRSVRETWHLEIRIKLPSVLHYTQKQTVGRVDCLNAHGSYLATAAGGIGGNLITKLSVSRLLRQTFILASKCQSNSLSHNEVSKSTLLHYIAV